MSPLSRRHLLCLLATLTTLYVATADNFSLVILHIGDMNAHFDQTSRTGKICTPEEAAKQNCYGGFGRVAHKVKEMKNLAKEKKVPPVIFLIAGDTFRGTTWFMVHKWKIVANLTNMLCVDAAALGSREFDVGVEGLASFLNAINYPVVASNMDVSEEPKLQGSPLKNSTILTIENRKIGIVGYVDSEAKILSQTGDVFFRHELQSVYQEAAELKKQGVDIILALGNADWDTDISIAREVPDVDVVIGSSYSIFLYTGDSPDPNIKFKFNRTYPHVVKKSVSGTQVPLVYAYRDTLFLGMLHVTFDTLGKVIDWKGNPIYLDNQIEEDPAVLEELGLWAKEVDEFKTRSVGVSLVNLTTKCRLEECNIGNLITDAILDAYVKTSQAPEDGWTKASIAWLNGGSVKDHDFDAFKEKSDANGPLPLGTVTWDDITGAVPYDNQMCMVTLTGKNLLKALEYSISTYTMSTNKYPSGVFSQFSGLRVNYDICKPKKQRVTSVQVRCRHCMVPTYIPLDLDEEYGVLLTDYLAQGGDKYTFLEDSVAYEVLHFKLQECVLDYLAKMSPVNPGLEGRITYSPMNCTRKDFFSRAPRNIMSFWPLLQGLVLVLLASWWSM